MKNKEQKPKKAQLPGQPNRETPKREEPVHNPYRVYPEVEPERKQPEPEPAPGYPMWLTMGDHDHIWVDEMTVCYSLN